MDPHSFIARAEAQRWLGIAEKLLMSHDLVGSKTFAIRARESDPRLEAADQILAIVDTLLAAEKRVDGNNGIQQPDFYAILQVVQFVQDTEYISDQFRRLAVVLNPHHNRFPYSDQAFQLVNDAWAVLSNPMRKSMYDSEIDFAPQQQMNHIGFNLEQHHHQHQQQQQHQHHHQQQQQHNFFSINHMASGHEHELTEPQQIFETRVQQSHQQQLQQHNFLTESSPIRPGQLFQPQAQPFMWPLPTPPPPAGPPQSLPFWPQAPPPFQQFQPQQQQQSVEQNANNGVIDEETETVAEKVDESPTFWTPCPYCLYMYEYPRVYADCTLRCCNCKRAFQAVPIPSPPTIIEDKEAYLCCWGFYPLGVSISHLEKTNNDNGTDTKSNWKPFSSLNDVSAQVKDHLNSKKNRFWAGCVYVDDVTDDIFHGISEPELSDDSDVDWGSTKRKKARRTKMNPSIKKEVKFVAKRNDLNVKNAIPVEKKLQEPTVPLAESSKTAVANKIRRQSGRVAKELGKLDLNVEFNNNEGEEPSRRMAGGNRGNGEGDEDNIEGIGFFEGLDEFLNSLPILSVENDEKGKAA